MLKLVFSNKYNTLITIVLVTLLFGVLYKLYIPRINAFGCFDDCFNIVGGYFILGGKTIYKDLFFNHQPGMAILSYFIQLVTHPSSIPELILRHRQTIILLSFFLTLLITLRFGLFFIVFSIIYETTKFYVFGDRFLAEGLVGYLLIYQLGAVLEKLIFKKSKNIDIFLIPLFTWVILFLREPFTLATLFLFVSYFLVKPNISKKDKKIYILSFLVPTLITTFSIYLPGYIFDMVVVNKIILNSEAQGQPLFIRLLKSIFYPIYLIISNESWNYFRTITAGLSLIYLLLGITFIKLFKKPHIFIFIALVLALANVRPPTADQSFYESFHLAPWYALLIFAIVFLCKSIYVKSKKTSYIFASFIVLFTFYFVTNKSYFAHEKVDLQNEFFTNYATVMGRGTIIRNLSSANNTLFLDDYDDLIYFEAKLKPSYKYSWYTSFMNQVPEYISARNEMFRKNPPDIYYGDCKGGQGKIPDFVKNNYTEVFEGKNVTCIHILKSQISKFTPHQKELVNTIYNLSDKPI